MYIQLRTTSFATGRREEKVFVRRVSPNKVLEIRLRRFNI